MPTLSLLIEDLRRQAIMVLLTGVLLLIAIGGCTYYVAQAGSRNDESFPVNAPVVAVQTPPSNGVRVERFSPQGTAKGVRQVTARFSEPIVVFGDPRQPEPFTITCPAPGWARWANARNWVYDFEHDLPGSVECRFVLKPDLKTLAGKPVSGDTTFTFNTGGPNVVASLPEEGDRGIGENQIFVLALDAEADLDTIREHLHCRIAGENELVKIKLLTGDERTKVLDVVESNRGFRYAADRVLTQPDKQRVVVQCRRELPAGTAVKLVWGVGIRSMNGIATDREQSLAFGVRPAFTAKFVCYPVAKRCNRDLDPVENNCDPSRPIQVNFSAPTAAKRALALRLHGADHIAAPELIVGESDEKVVRIRFAGPFPEKTEFRLEWPADFADEEGRPLVTTTQFPAQVTTGTTISCPPPPALVTFVRGDILEARIGGLLPVVLDNVKGEVQGRWFKPGTPKDATSGELAGTTQQDQGIIQWLERIRLARRNSSSVFDENTPTHAFAVPRADGDGKREVAGIPLEKPGFYVVELIAPTTNRYTRYTVTEALVTNLGVHFKEVGEGAGLVWVTTLDGAQPVPEAEVAIRDRDGHLLWRGRTDRNGIARTGEISLPRSTCDRMNQDWKFFISARTADDLSFTLSPCGHGHSPSPIIHTVFDRALFRVGETVSMKHFLRLPTLTGFEVPPATGRPKTLTVSHFDSDQEWTLPLAWDERGIALSAWTIPRDAKLGRYYVKLDSEESGSFEVAEFRIPAMTARIDPPAEPLVNAGTAEVGVAVRFLNGGPAAHWPITLRIQIQDWHGFDVPVHPGFSFYGAVTTKGCDAYPDAIQVIPLTLNAEGTARPRLSKLPRVCVPRDLQIELDYQDANGERLSATKLIPLWPARIRLGLKADRILDERRPLPVSVVALDLAGRPVANQPVTVERFQQKLCVGKTDSRGLLTCETRITIAGIEEQVTLRARTRDDLGNVAVTDDSVWVWNLEPLERDAKAGIVEAAEILELQRRLFRRSAPDATELQISPDKPDYAPGETAHLQLRLPFREATALVTVEREGVLDSFVTRLAGESPMIEVPITDRYAPNVFVSVLAVRGRLRDAGPPTPEDDDPGRPDVRLGSVAIPVQWTPHRLEVRVMPERQVYSVREPARIRIEVTRADGKPLPAGAEVALAAVDEALLELVPNDSWTTLLEKMMAERPHQVATATLERRIVGRYRYGWVEEWAELLDRYGNHDLYQNLRESINRRFGRRHMNGGDGDGEPSTVRELFDTLLAWRGRVLLDAQGRAEVTVPLNDSLSAFRLVAVASAGVGHFGSGQATIRTTQDVMLYAGLPPLVREGDQFTALFTVRNGSTSPLKLAAAAQVSAEPGGRVPAALPRRELSLAPGEAREVAWPMTVPPDVGALAWELAVRQPNGKVGDRLRVRQTVTPALPVRTYQATLTQLDQPFNLTVERPAAALPNRGSISVALRASLGDGLSGVTEYMAHYPYGCLEQLTSAAVALRDPDRWQAIMKKLPDYLDEDGLLKYFPSEYLKGNDVLTTYVLAIAHEAGWSLPEEHLSEVLEGLEAVATGRLTRVSVLPATDDTVRRLAAIEALSRYNKAELEMLDGITLDPNRWPTSALLDWIAILKRLETIEDRPAKRQQALQILRSRLNFQGTSLSFSTESTDRLWWLMVSADLNAVRAILSLVDEPSWRDELPRLVRGALGRQQRGHWDTTTANAWGRLALERFSAVFESQPVTGRTEAALGGQVRVQPWRGKAPPEALDFAWPAGPQTLTVTHAGTGRPWAIVQSRAALPLQQPLFTGYAIRRRVTPVEQRQPDVWSRGDVARVRLELDAQSDMTWVVVNDPIPAGASLLGTGFGRDSRILTEGEQHEDGAWSAFEERRFDSFRAYYEFVPKGAWTLEYTVRYNTPGRYELPPTRVEALYAPEMFGEAPNAAVEVRE